MANWIMRVIFLWQAIASSEAGLSMLTCFEIFHRDKSAQLTCPDGIIASVDVKSGTGSCAREEGKCYGNTPSLIVNYHQCYWHPNCDLKWPSGNIVSVENGGNCLGKLPTFMQMSYKCFPMKKRDEQPDRLLLNVCENLVDGQSVTERVMHKHAAGLIRSHQNYPWNYSNAHRFCSFKFYWPERQNLFVTVHNADLSENDSLVIGNDIDKNMVKSGTSYFVNSRDGMVTFFNFTVGPESVNGEGFLVCFKFYDTDKTVTDACSFVMDDGVLHTEASPDLTTDVTPTAPETTAKSLPKRCRKLKKEKSRRKCVARYIKRQEQRRKNRKTKKGNKKRNRKSRKQP